MPQRTNKYIAEVEADLASLIPGFLENRKKDLQDLEKALAIDDFQKLKQIGHILKGVAGSYGFDLIGQYGSEIEAAASSQDKSTIDQRIKMIAHFLDHVEIVYI